MAKITKQLRHMAKFVPSHEYRNTPLLLRDNSPTGELLKKILSDTSWMEPLGLLHMAVGYDPKKNGSPMPRGCGNKCLSCFFDEMYIQSKPQHILGVENTTPASLSSDLYLFMSDAQKKAEQRVGRQIVDGEKRIRISGDVRGDPIMADYQTTKKLVAQIKDSFPPIPVLIDTAANQYVLSPDEWKALGADSIMVSINAVSSEEAYMVFHGVGRGRFSTAQQNIRNIDNAGIRVGLSYVWGYHPRLSAEQHSQMPRYVLDGQSEKAREAFIQSLGLTHEPMQRFWFFSTGAGKDLKRIKDGDIRYERLRRNPH